MQMWLQKVSSALPWLLWSALVNYQCKICLSLTPLYIWFYWLIIIEPSGWTALPRGRELGRGKIQDGRRKQNGGSSADRRAQNVGRWKVQIRNKSIKIFFLIYIKHLKCNLKFIFIVKYLLVWILEKNIAEMVQSVRILSVDNDKLIQVNHKD